MCVIRVYFGLTADPVYHDDIHVVVDESLFHHPLVKATTVRQ